MWEQGGDIKAQRFDASVAKQGSTIAVNAGHSGTQVRPVIVAFTDNTFAIVYDDSGADAIGGTGTGVLLQLFNSDGTKNGNEVLVNTYTTSSQYHTTIDRFSDNSFVVAWDSYGQIDSDSRHEVYFQRFDSSGNKVGSETLVNTGRTIVDQMSPYVKVLADDTFIVGYYSDDDSPVYKCSAGSATTEMGCLYHHVADGSEYGDLTLTETICKNYGDAVDGVYYQSTFNQNRPSGCIVINTNQIWWNSRGSGMTQRHCLYSNSDGCITSTGYS